MERVADRYAKAKNAIGVEVAGVVDDVVVIRFGPDKEISPRPVVESAAHVKQKMIAVQMGRAAVPIDAVAVWVVVKHGLAAGAGREDSAGSL